MITVVVGFCSDAGGAEYEWTYDFSSGSLATDWTFNTNNPAVVNVGSAGLGTAAISKTATTVFHAAAQHGASYGMGVGDTLRLSLAWAPFMTQNASGGYNQVFQLGVLNDAAATDTFSNGDGFWLTGREVAATLAPGPDLWGTQTLDLWIHTDQASTANPITAEYLGQIVIDSYRAGTDGSNATTFLDIDLELEITTAGSFDYTVVIDAYDWTELGGDVGWTPGGTILSDAGSRTDDLDSRGDLHPTIGYVVSDSSNEGAMASYWSNVPVLVPEPQAASMLMLGALLIGLRRRR